MKQDPKYEEAMRLEKLYDYDPDDIMMLSDEEFNEYNISMPKDEVINNTY